MSDRMTSIELPGVPRSGIADYGKISAEKMISLLRAKARHDKQVAEIILASSDNQFHIETYIGMYARTNLTIIQEGTEAKSEAKMRQNRC